MKKEGRLIAAIFSFLVLFSSAVYAENCCLRPQSNFCTDVSAQSCCGTDANCLNTQYFQGASCSDFCFGGKGCCLDSCTDAWIAGTSTPIACSSPQVYSQKPCAEYSECTSGCAFCSNYTASIGNFPLFIASQKCSNLSRRLSLFNTSTTACMNISQASSTLFSVSGKVTDAGGAPVPGVSIKIAGSAATTTSSGNYRITNLPVGNFTVRAWHINYNESLTPLFIDSNKTFDIVLQKIQTATLTVNVFNSDNSPADGAAVTADSASLTAAGGIAVFSDLPILQPNGLRRYYRITASLGGAQNSATINLSSGANTVSITLPSAVVGTGSLSGYIINSSGFPVNGATVSIAGREYFTLANGLYQFSDLPATSYEITAMPPQPYLQKTDSISIAAGEVLAHNITVNALSAENVAILTVEVVNWTDTFEKIEGATVTIRLAGAITPEAVLTTGADGKAVVTLPVAEYFVTAEKAGYQMTVPPQYVDLSGDKTEQVWLKKLIFVGFSLSGTVTDVETMKPIDRASV